MTQLWRLPHDIIINYVMAAVIFYCFNWDSQSETSLNPNRYRDSLQVNETHADMILPFLMPTIISYTTNRRKSIPKQVSMHLIPLLPTHLL